MELRTQTQPLVAKHIGGTIRAQNDRSRTRRTDEVPFIVGCSHFTRKNTRFGAPVSSPKHSPRNIHAAITIRFATSRGKSAPIYARGNIKWRQWSSHSNAICNQRFKNRIELRTQTQPLVAKHIGGTIRAQNDRSRTRRTHEVPFIAGCSHFTRKNTRFRAPASSPKHSPCNIHAAITRRFAASRGKPAPIYARGNIKWRQWSSHSNAICNQRFKNRIELRTQTQPLVAKHIGGTIRAQNDRSRTRRTDEVPFIVGCSHFTRKNTRFGAPASSPKHSPCNIHAAITIRFATSRGKPAPIYARGNIKWRQWSSHSNAICNQRFKNRIELRTQTQPLVAKHIGGTIRAQNDRSRTRRTHTRYTFHRRLQCTLHGKTQGFVLRLPPQNKAHATFMQPFQCNLQPQLQEKPLYTEKHKVSCSGFLPNSPLPFLTASHRHHFPSSPPPFVPTSLRHHFPFLTTSHRPHLPSSPLPLHHHTSLRHHFPSSPLPFVTTSLRHHFPSSPLPFVTTSLRHHFPSSPPVIITTLHQSQFHCSLFFCYVLLCYVLFCDLPPCIMSSRRILFVRNTEVLLPNFLWQLWVWATCN